MGRLVVKVVCEVQRDWGKIGAPEKLTRGMHNVHMDSGGVCVLGQKVDYTVGRPGANINIYVVRQKSESARISSCVA